MPLARHLCRATLRGLGVEEECIEDIELAVTEACSNVLRHAGGEDEYEVAVTVNDFTCKIEIRDKGNGSPGYMSSNEWLTSVAEGGRGIHLMQSLVDELKFTKLRDGTVVTLRKALTLQPTSLLHQVAQVTGPYGRRPTTS